MNVVVVCTKYSTSTDSPYLTDELANQFTKQGHNVTVLLADWSSEHNISNIQLQNYIAPHLIVSQPIIINWLPKQIRLIIKWALSSIKIGFDAHRILRRVKPDLVVAFSPLVAVYLPVLFLTSNRSQRRFLVQWDFFPDAQVQIRILTGQLTIKVLKALESFLMRRFDVIGCMSPKNIEYLLNNYVQSPNARYVHLPLWTSQPAFKLKPRDEVRQHYNIPIDSKVFVFGGQMIRGRGIEDVLIAAQHFRTHTDSIMFLFVGNGPLVEAIKTSILVNSRVLMHIPSISREDYLSLIAACDVGIVCTLRDVTVPTFPSKTMDYLLAGLPILASVEAATDYGDFIESNGVGLKVLAGDVDGMVSAVERFSSEPSMIRMMHERCGLCLVNNFSMGQAYNIIAKS